MEFETVLQSDLSKPVQVKQLTGNLFSGDNKGNKITVEVFDNGSPATLTGDVSGYVIRADGKTVVIADTQGTHYTEKDGNRFSVILPQSAYVVVGQVSIVIKVGTMTVGACTSYVYKSTTDQQIDPGSVVPDISTLLGIIEDCIGATEAANTATLAATSAAAYAIEVAENMDSVIKENNYVFYADIEGEYVKSNGDIANNSVLKVSDYIAIPNNAVTVTMYCLYTKTSTSELKTISPIAVFFSNNTGTVTDYYNGTTNVDGYRTFQIPSGSKYVRFNVSNVANDQGNILFRFNYVDKAEVSEQIVSEVPRALGLVGSYSGTFSSQQSLDTGILLKANTEYHIVNKTVLTKAINVYRNGDTSNYKKLASQYNYTNFANGSTAGNLMLYNSDSNLDSVDIEVYERSSTAEELTYGVHVYSVSKSSNYTDYTSLTQCLLDLKDDESEKIIHIYGGDYDIFQEYDDANVPVYDGNDPDNEYFDYCVWVPKNTHIIGHGLVRLIYMPDAEDTTYNQARTVSPLNVAATATIENIEVHCKNGRYCLHNDTLDKQLFNNAVQRFINCKFYKYAHDTVSSQNLGTIHTTGFGIGAYQTHEYVNCEFNNEDTGYAFYGHATQAINGSNIDSAKSSEIKLVNCSIVTAGNTAIKLGTVTNTDQHIRTRFTDCYINKKIKIEKEGGSTEKRNPFDLLLLNSGTVDISIADTNNPYPPVIYNSIIPWNVATDTETQQIIADYVG